MRMNHLHLTQVQVSTVVNKGKEKKGLGVDGRPTL